MQVSSTLVEGEPDRDERPLVRRRSAWRRKAYPYALVAPAVLYLVGITLYPGLFAVYQSFFRVRFNRWIFTGLENYQQLFGDADFWFSLWNTVLLGSISLAVQASIALLLAALTYRDPFVRGWRVAFLLPMLFMPSAVSFIWKLLFNDGRVVNDLLTRLHVIEAPLDFLGNTSLARLSLVVVDVWQWTPFLFVIFVAALQGQDPEIEEAARLDGASWPQIFWSVSLPVIRPVVAIAMILRGIDVVTTFTSVFIITGGSPAGATETVSYFVYRTAFKQFNFGYASAASVLLLILTTVLAQSVVKRFFKSGKA